MKELAFGAIFTRAVNAPWTTALKPCQEPNRFTVAQNAIDGPVREALVEQAHRVPAAEPRPRWDGKFSLLILERRTVRGRIDLVDVVAAPIDFNVNLRVPWTGAPLQSDGATTGGPEEKARAASIPLSRICLIPISAGSVACGDHEGHQAPDAGPTKSNERCSTKHPTPAGKSMVSPHERSCEQL